MNPTLAAVGLIECEQVPGAAGKSSVCVAGPLLGCQLSSYMKHRVERKWKRTSSRSVITASTPQHWNVFRPLWEGIVHNAVPVVGPVYLGAGAIPALNVLGRGVVEDKAALGEGVVCTGRDGDVGVKRGGESEERKNKCYCQSDERRHFEEPMDELV